MTGQAIILGLIQGLTEFFPVSSSAHLILLRPVFNLGEPSLWFDVLLHGGTWFAVLIYLLPYYSRAFRHPRIILNILLATIPAGLLGYLLEDIVENYLRNRFLEICLLLIILGLVFLMVKERGDKTLENMTGKAALFIGFAQALALFPGVSRSGITLLAGLLCGLQEKEAVLFSFFLSVTTIGGAFILGIRNLSVSGNLLSPELVSGFLASLGSGLLACFLLLKIVEKKGLKPFGYYRILFGGIMFIWFLVH
ncbi:MAG TPA: undecaprenyl-diphosphate phosphatase [Candidatus Atribacteria bacterium]|nr:undecaprenyl-diphosphate phosphatase [Candidatus Atribacteria bacterium]